MVRVLGDRVLVALPPAEDETVSPAGIVLVRDPDAKKTPTRGLVVQVGEKAGSTTLDEMEAMFRDLAIDGKCDLVELVANLSLLHPAPFDVQVGDCVIFPPSAGEEFTENDIDYVVLRESEIIGIVEPKEEAAA